MPPDAPVTSPRRARRLGVLLAGATVALGAAGAAWFFRFAEQARRDPGVVYRDPTTLDNLLQRASEAEQARGRGRRIPTHRLPPAAGGRETEAAHRPALPVCLQGPRAA